MEIVESDKKQNKLKVVKFSMITQNMTVLEKKERVKIISIMQGCIMLVVIFRIRARVTFGNQSIPICFIVHNVFAEI